MEELALLMQAAAGDAPVRGVGAEQLPLAQNPIVIIGVAVALIAILIIIYFLLEKEKSSFNKRE